MATITIKVRNGKALVTDNPTRNKVVIINYDILIKQVGESFLYAGEDRKNFPYLEFYKHYILLSVGERDCIVKVRDSLLEDKYIVSAHYFVQTFVRNDD